MLRLSEGLGLPVRTQRSGRRRERSRIDPAFAWRPVREESYLRAEQKMLLRGAPAPLQRRSGLMVEKPDGGTKARPKACLGARKVEGKGIGRA